MTDLEFIKEVIEQKKDTLIIVSEKIWKYAELSYEEFKSQALLCDVLETEDFKITQNIAEMPTAFTAEFISGDGKPVMGFLGEYDALDSLSQQAGCTNKAPVKLGAPGHGCGHNLLGAGSLGAAITLKEYLVRNGKSGTVVYYGCPAEEGAGSKQFMARAGVFDNADFIYTWHPDTRNGVDSNHSNAIMGANFEFRGISAHAGGSPHLGRSALDATELMSVGSNYLREHTIDKARIHYAYANAGGTAPNVVQDYTLVKYEVRSPKVAQVKDLFARLVNVAKGAALITDTTVTHQVTMAFSDYIPNDELAKIATQCFNEVGATDWNDEDYSLARDYLNSYDEKTLEAIKGSITETYGAENLEAILESPLSSTIFAYSPDKTEISGGSTDVGDVTYVVPTLNLRVATACIGNVGHSWQNTGQASSRIGQKGMLTAAKVLALCAIRTMDNPEAIKRAKEFVLKQNGGRYSCPLPDDVTPPIGTY